MRTREKTPPNSSAAHSARRVDLEHFEAQLAEWTALIGQYRASARRVEADSRLELDHLTDELQLRRNEAGAQVRRLKSASDDEWERQKSQVEQTWEVARSSFQKVKARL